MTHATPYAELNGVLDHLLAGVRAVLGENFVGLYLQGSFAVGDFTPWSDCDFIVVTARDIRPDELAPLQALHAAIHELPALYWRHALEGSYVPAPILRRWSTEPRDPPGEARGDDWGDPGTSGSPPLAYPFWYLDHGANHLVRSEHDNTQVVRWCLRERGVPVAGPDPKTLIDPISPDALKAEVRATMDRVMAVGMQPMVLAAWQAFWVGLFCRILHTLATGEITSKPRAMTWAQDTLDPCWRPLIGSALGLKKGDTSQSMVPVTPEQDAETRAFAAYAMAYADASVRETGGD